LVEVDGVSVEDVVAVGYCGVDVLVEFAGVERGVVIVAHGEGDGVRGSRLESASSAHKVLCECLLSVLVEVEAAPAGARAVGTATATSHARRVSIGVVVAVVGRRYFVVVVGMISNIVELFFGRSSGKM
jgi:hypothetical protein